MALIKCKDCGEKMSKKATACPKCGAPNKKKSGGGIGCGGLVVILIAIGVISSMYTNSQDEATKEASRKAQQEQEALRNKLAHEKKAKERKVFMDSIETQYENLQTHKSNGDLENAIKLLDEFSRYNQMNYEEVNAINGVVRTEYILKKLETYEENDYNNRIKSYKELSTLNPDASVYKENIEKYTSLKKEADAKKKAEMEAAKKEEQRLAELNDTGSWLVGEYTDKFGDKTGERYITNKSQPIGVFSNTATQDSALKVSLLISSDESIDIKLFEYGGKNPVKTVFGSDAYSIDVKAKDDVRLSLKGNNYSDRITINKADSKKLYECFMKGGTIKFVITNTETPTSIYNFVILNTIKFENADRILRNGE